MASKNALTRALLLVEEFRKVYPEFPPLAMSCLLLIADKPRISLKELGDRTGAGKSTINRTAAMLAGGWGTPLIQYGRDPLDARNNVAWMTPQGERLIRSVLHYMEP